MKKFKWFAFFLLLCVSLNVFAATPLQPFIGCKVELSRVKGWKFDLHLDYSSGFPLNEAKLFLILYDGSIHTTPSITEKRIELPLQKTVTFEWNNTFEHISFCLPPVKYDIMRVKDRSLLFGTESGQILFPGKRVTVFSWKWIPLTGDAPPDNEPVAGSLALELQIPEKVLQKYAKFPSYKDLMVKKFLEKLKVPDYWQYAKEFPEVPKNVKCFYRTYPPMIRKNIEILAGLQSEFESGKIPLPPILEQEIRIIEMMLYAKNLPETMRKKLVMEAYQRHKQVLNLTRTKYAAGAEDAYSVAVAEIKLDRFMKQHNIKESESRK